MDPAPTLHHTGPQGLPALARDQSQQVHNLPFYRDGASHPDDPNVRVAVEGDDLVLYTPQGHVIALTPLGIAQGELVQQLCGHHPRQGGRLVELTCGLDAALLAARDYAEPMSPASGGALDPVALAYRARRSRWPRDWFGRAIAVVDWARTPTRTGPAAQVSPGHRAELISHNISPSVLRAWEEAGWSIAQAMPFWARRIPLALAQPWLEAGEATRAGARAAQAGLTPHLRTRWTDLGIAPHHAVHWARHLADQRLDVDPAHVVEDYRRGMTLPEARNVRDNFAHPKRVKGATEADFWTLVDKLGVPAHEAASWWHYTRGNLDRIRDLSAHLSLAQAKAVSTAMTSIGVEVSGQDAAAWLARGFSGESLCVHVAAGVDLDVADRAYRQLPAGKHWWGRALREVFAASWEEHSGAHSAPMRPWSEVAVFMRRHGRGAGLAQNFTRPMVYPPQVNIKQQLADRETSRVAAAEALAWLATNPTPQA